MYFYENKIADDASILHYAVKTEVKSREFSNSKLRNFIHIHMYFDCIV